MKPSDRDEVNQILIPSALRVDLDAELERKWALVWVLRENEASQALGFLLAWHVVDELHLLEIATHPDFRRRGVARTLLSALVQKAQEVRARLVLLEVRRSNDPAIALYRSLGFRATGIRRAYYADNGEDALEMRLLLDPQTGQILPLADEVS